MRLSSLVRPFDEAIYDPHGEEIVDNYVYWAADKIATCRSRTALLQSYAEKWPATRQKRRARDFERVLGAAAAIRQRLADDYA